jgi:hypothetical protein
MPLGTRVKRRRTAPPPAFRAESRIDRWPGLGGFRVGVSDRGGAATRRNDMREVKTSGQ